MHNQVFSSKHGDAFALAQESALNAEAVLNNKDIEFFICSVIDGNSVYAEMGGHINDDVLKGLENLVNEMKKHKKAGIFTYTSTKKTPLMEVRSDVY